MKGKRRKRDILVDLVWVLVMWASIVVAVLLSGRGSKFIYIDF